MELGDPLSCSKCGAMKAEDGGTEEHLYRRKTGWGEILCRGCIEEEYMTMRAERAVRRREWLDRFKGFFRRR